MEKLEGKIAVLAHFGDSNRLPYETLRLTLGRWLSTGCGGLYSICIQVYRIAYELLKSARSRRRGAATRPVLAGDRHAGLGAPYAAKRPRRACWRSEHRSGRPGSMRPRGATLRVRASATFASHTRQHVLAGDRRELVCVCTSTLSLTTRRRTSDSQRAESRRAARGELRTAAAPRSRALGPMF